MRSASEQWYAVLDQWDEWAADFDEARGGTLARRQDLPADAFFSAAELRRLVDRLGDDYGLLFVALSYRHARAI